MTWDTKMVGFNRETDLLEAEWDLPAGFLARVRAIAKVPASDRDILGSYPLDEHQVATIAELVQATVDPSRYLYFLEAYSTPHNAISVA